MLPELEVTDVAAVVVTVGGNGTVVKFHVLEYVLVPALFLAFTRQKYLVLFNNVPTEREVVVIVESSTTLPLANVLSVPTCKRYDVAPLDTFHDKVKVVIWFVEPLTGALKTGDRGGDTTTCVTCETHED